MKVSVEACNGRLRLRWKSPEGGARRTLYMGLPDTKTNRLAASQLSAAIELDILSGNYDPTLEKYRTVKQKNDLAYKRLMVGLRKRLRERHNTADEALLRVLEIYGNPICNAGDADKFFLWLRDERNLAVSSRKRYRDTLRVISPEIFGKIELERVPRNLPKPFTKTEVQRILGHFDSTHWGDYVHWLLKTGMRPSEAIGLRWKDVDFLEGVARVESTLRRSRGSSSKRERSTTKTGRSRVVPLSTALVARLWPRRGEPDELIFTAPRGGAIDDRNFRRRYWKPALEQLGIEYRPPYKCRSTAESHLLAAGIPLVDVAAIAGHRPETLMRHYAGSIHRIELPDLYE